MRPISTLALSTLLACGPLAAPSDAGSTTDETTTTQPPNPTSTSPPTTTIDSTTTAALDPTTTTETTAKDFIVTPDNGPEGTIQCDVFKQDCDPGKKCVPWADDGAAWNATKCVDIIGDGAPGDPCTTPDGGTAGIDDCGFGAFCWEVDENLHGTCVAQCTGTSDAPICPPKSSCGIAGDGVLNLCIANCDPLLQDCSSGDLCIPNGDAFLCVLDASGDEGQFNDPCEFANSCDKGLVCLETATASAACDQNIMGCCQPFCEFPDSPCPNPDQQCLQWFAPMQPIPQGYETIGICKLPD